MLFPQYRLLVMSKAPELGRVKTRMQPQLTPKESVRLHIALTQYCLQQWVFSALCNAHVWVGGDLPLFQDAVLSPLSYAIKQGLLLQEQPLGSLGDRMSYAVKETIDPSVDGVILLGTDCPFIDKKYLQTAIQQLAEGNDVVIGPANDGGYVLLGMKQHYAELFTDITWGSDNVFAATMAKIKQQNLCCHVLSTLNDIDHFSDLTLLSHLPNVLSYSPIGEDQLMAFSLSADHST